MASFYLWTVDLSIRRFINVVNAYFIYVTICAVTSVFIFYLCINLLCNFCLYILSMYQPVLWLLSLYFIYVSTCSVTSVFIFYLCINLFGDFWIYILAKSQSVLLFLYLYYICASICSVCIKSMSQSVL